MIFKNFFKIEGSLVFSLFQKNLVLSGQFPSFQTYDQRSQKQGFGKFQQAKISAPAGQDSFEEWIDFEDRLKAKYRDEYVPSEVFLAVRQHDSHVVGIIDFRHPLFDFLFNYGGNIGYSVRPSERQKGYASENA